MQRSLRDSSGQSQLDLKAHVSAPADAPRQPLMTTAVGASYAFDPGVDGLASIYAARMLERGIDPRALCAEIRADRLGIVDWGPHRRALLARTRTSRFGRGTAAHLRLQGSLHQPLPPSEATVPKRPDRAVRQIADQRPGLRISWSRKLAAAGLAVLLLLPIGVIVAHAQEAPLQSRYVNQPGGIFDSVAWEFGVHPAGILTGRSIGN